MKDGNSVERNSPSRPMIHTSPTRGRCHLVVCISATHYCGLTGAHVPPRTQNANRESRERERERPPLDSTSKSSLRINRVGQMVDFLPLFGFYNRLTL